MTAYAIHQTPARSRGWLRSTRVWIGLGVLVPLGMVALCSVMLFEMRKDAWDKADETAKNLVEVIERDIDRNVEVIDLALQGTIKSFMLPDVEEISPEYRQRILFDRAVNAKDLGVMLVLDEHGNSIYDSAGWPAQRLNNAGRDYFQAHKRDPGLGLHISRPLISTLMSKPIIVLSRRINKVDGSFGGIALGSLSLSYFDRLFERIKLGQSGTITLFLDDGTRLVRHPKLDPGHAPNFTTSAHVELFRSDGRGSFVGISPSDGIERFYTFTQVGELPLYLTLAISTHEIEAKWRAKAVVIGLLVLTLCGLTVGLSFMVGGELRRRATVEAELAYLSHTDPLTSLANRRAFDMTSGLAWAEARKRGSPIALLVVDADHFKCHNDRHGHAVGDRVLQALARAIASSVRRPGDLAARVGGEEFAVLLADTNPEEAARVAEAIHEAVAELVVEVEGVGIGLITVSIGLAFGLPGRNGSVVDLLSLADATLYRAKASGRNQTCFAVMGITCPMNVRPDLGSEDYRCPGTSQSARALLNV